MKQPVKSVPFTLIDEFIDRLGFETRDVASIAITPGRIEVTQFRYDDHGSRFTAGRDQIATITVAIAIEDPGAGR